MIEHLRKLVRIEARGVDLRTSFELFAVDSGVSQQNDGLRSRSIGVVQDSLSDELLRLARCKFQVDALARGVRLALKGNGLACYQHWVCS